MYRLDNVKTNLVFINPFLHSLFHVTDWLPSLYSAIGGNMESLGKIDGIDQWNALIQLHTKSKRKDILYMFNTLRGAIRFFKQLSRL